MRRRPKAPPRGTLGEYAESPRSDLRAAAEQLRGFGGGALWRTFAPPPNFPPPPRKQAFYNGSVGPVPDGLPDGLEIMSQPPLDLDQKSCYNLDRF